MKPYLLLFLLLSVAMSSIHGQTDDQWDLLITDVQVFTGNEVLKATDIGVKDGMITHLGPQLARQRRASQVINGEGYTLLPGLVNTHVHTWFPFHLQQAAQAGIFAVCDMHGSAFTAQLLGQFKDTIGYAHYYAAGSGATVPGGHGTQFGMPVPTIDSVTSARQFTLDRIAEGVDYIKILREPMRPTLSFEQIDTIIQTAHERGVKVVSHVSRCADGVELARLGIDGLVHVWFDRAMTDEELRVFEQREDFFIVPTTLTNMKLLAYFEQQAEKPAETLDSLGILNEIRRLHGVGVQVLAGTDPPNFGINHGSDLYEELILLAAAGIPNQECLAGATVKSAHYFGLAGPLPLQVGAAASFLLIKGDPLKSMEDLRQLEGVWQKGRRIFPVQKR
ncbi:amidohydrolase family protein [Lewinella sp. LCG006]|uniref:amidohydrolase family protein n=1 Tax=Lewinella sp. LCG006 TaxID=3231911 RepID=UPI003460851B